MTTAQVTSLNANIALRRAPIFVTPAFSPGKCRQVLLNSFIAIILIVPFLMIAAAFPASAQSGDTVGVIYFDEDERIFGVSSDHTDLKQAEQVAKKTCESSGGRKCIFAVEFRENQCGALADGNDDWSADYGSSNASARSNALAGCRKHTKGCKVIVAACNRPGSSTAAAPPPSCPSGYSLRERQCIRDSAPASSGSAASSTGSWVFIVRKSLGVRTARDLSGATVCVVSGSASEAAVSRYFRTNQMTFSPFSVNGDAAAKEGYQRSGCDALVVEHRIASSVANTLSPRGGHQVLPEQIGGAGGSSPPPIRRAAPAPAPTANLAYPLQSELKRLGCLTGRVDGVWGGGSKAALRRFSNQAGLRLGSEATQKALDEARRTDSGYCKPVRAAPKRTKPKGCRSGTVFLEGQCIPKSEVASFCGPGFTRSGSKCVQMGTIKKKARCSAIKFAFTKGNTCACSGGRIFTGNACMKPAQAPWQPGECRVIGGEEVCS